MGSGLRIALGLVGMHEKSKVNVALHSLPDINLSCSSAQKLDKTQEIDRNKPPIRSILLISSMMQVKLICMDDGTCFHGEAKDRTGSYPEIPGLTYASSEIYYCPLAHI